MQSQFAAVFDHIVMSVRSLLVHVGGPDQDVIHQTSSSVSKSPNFKAAIILTMLAGLATGLGAFVVILQKDISWKQLGAYQAFAAGFMLAVCFFDLAPKVISESDNYLHSALFFLAGIAFMVGLKKVLPEPDLSSLWIGGGYPAPAHYHHFQHRVADESGGEAELANGRAINPGISRSGSNSSSGGGASGDLVVIPPRPSERAIQEVLISGILTGIGIAAHNFPEGIAVCVSSLANVQVGVKLCIAIAMHNILEGVVLGLPVYFVSRNATLTFGLVLLSGLFEPLGVLFVMMFTLESFTPGVLSSMLSGVTGIMFSISVFELIPQSAKYGSIKTSLIYVAASIAFMAGLLHVVNIMEAD